MRDIEPVLRKIRETVASHRLSREGEYARTTLGLAPGEAPRINEYGVADAANILYTLGDLRPSPAFREGFVSALKSMQHPDTGLFSEPTHFPVHTTAHCTAALELFDERPLPPKDLLPYLSKDRLYELMDSLEWVSSPWNNSHIGAGVYVASIMANGDVGACLDIERRPETSQGNIRESRFKDLWENRFELFRRDLCEGSEFCAGCEHAGHCRGDAHHSWNYDKNEPMLCFKNLLF